MVFGDDQYASESLRGRHLLAHELTHVLQQSEDSLVAPLAMGSELTVQHTEYVSCTDEKHTNDEAILCHLIFQEAPNF